MEGQMDIDEISQDCGVMCYLALSELNNETD